MICKACGKSIPSDLLRKDSFSCPTCGQVYRRNTSSSPSKPTSREPRSSSQHKGKSKPALSGGAPIWLVIVLAALLVVTLVICTALLVNRNSGNAFRLSGIYKSNNIAVGKTKKVVIEIPEQPNTNYMVLTESNQTGVGCSVNEKTNTSFQLVIRNLYTDKRAPTITWGLIPFTPTEQVPAS